MRWHTFREKLTNLLTTYCLDGANGDMLQLALEVSVGQCHVWSKSLWDLGQTTLAAPSTKGAEATTVRAEVNQLQKRYLSETEKPKLTETPEVHLHAKAPTKPLRCLSNPPKTGFTPCFYANPSVIMWASCDTGTYSR